MIKTEDDDLVIGFIAGAKSDLLVLETEKSGKQFEIAADPKQVKGARRQGPPDHQARAARRGAASRSTIQPLANAEGGQGVN